MADIYGTPGGARSYWAARGYDVPPDASDDDTVNEWLLVGSEYLDGRYLLQFPGWKTGQRAQIREWPRTAAWDIYAYVIPSDSVPREVENATYEVALRQGVKPGSLIVDYTPNKYVRASVDGAVSVQYVSFASALDIQTQFTIVDQILTPILTADGGGSFSSLSGAASRI